MNTHKRLIAALLFGNFLIGTGVMFGAGLLLPIASEFNLSAPQAGWLITVGAVGICFCSPLLATMTSRLDRQHVLAASLALYAAGHVVCALMPTFWSLVVARAITLLGAALFTPQAAATVGLILPPEKRAAGITSIFLGWSVASVVGVPLSAWIGAHLGWRITYAGFGLFALIGVIWVWRVIPAGLTGTSLSIDAWMRVAKHPALIAILLVTAASASGQFTTFAYIAPFTAALLSTAPSALTIGLFIFGAAGVVGNVLATRSIAVRGASFNVTLSIASMMAGMAIMTLFASHWIGYAIAAIAWGGGIFANNSSQQARLAGASPELAGVSIALNTSMIYLGQAVGTTLGGAVITGAGMRWLPLVGGTVLCFALLLSLRATMKLSVATSPQ
jgi:MFS transporter, DHA1 family, inner membrane transport protein